MSITGRILRSNVDMTQGKPLIVIFSFALPLLVGNLFNQLYNVVDTAIVGRALGADALAAVGSTGNINACLFLLLGGLSTGVGVIVAQYWGAQRYEALRRLLGTFFTLLLAGSVLLSVLGVALAAPILRLLQIPADLLGMGVTYLRITAGLLLGNALYNAASAVGALAAEKAVCVCLGEALLQQRGCRADSALRPAHSAAKLYDYAGRYDRAGHCQQLWQRDDGRLHRRAAYRLADDSSRGVSLQRPGRLYRAEYGPPRY